MQGEERESGVEWGLCGKGWVAAKELGLLETLPRRLAETPAPKIRQLPGNPGHPV